ncbi:MULTISPECIES: TVP38/TMEM64 family protein [Prochlorococcus]|uniref:TVP38/TMEM64 family membrane protein n=1 Tax=Prochlorococcus marinus (strain SARG / CCMP1375 / SS120) TaxID=167539 RepID=Q7VDJ8_PROMA|nr:MULTISPECIES: VTT domain-containing protein [Prochlorococcus]AAP99424.1 Uncharacterized conserved membrane protein [Prochlorococcus marinus subsp. marinus str. CCMP1375]KGG11309.1 hypothetical protein EV04_1387 [Prochlorococcus marinus str. LG]KGG18736.1 hypothetical protein EV08_1985 [Prochlorococcus marinus str. SS2]KGG23010.1 hypothetical protein EV09_1753 [Prochlorococcus marinus str. SS35]KGG33717.1 hypothetical protein EV10_0152 [Prochlorococcus marinus str. SS51]
MKQLLRIKFLSKYSFLAVLAIILIFSYQSFDINQINNLIESSQEKKLDAFLPAVLLIFFLRFISIIIPILPGTYCSVISGYLFGIKGGLILIFFADFLSCSCSFLLSRNLGRGFVRKILGSQQMQRVEKISKNYLEDNFFLMTGFLMTQFFDFVCYAIGLTKVSWKKFMPALIISILISDIPFVAGGYTISALKDISIKQVLSGEVQALKGPYLMLFIISVMIIFGLGALNIFLKKRSN